MNHKKKSLILDSKKLSVTLPTLSRKMKIIVTVPILVLLCFATLVCRPQEKEHNHKDVNVSAAEKMQKMVISISDYAKKVKPGFLVIPQNGIELAFKKADSRNGLNDKYLKAIDGLGVEEVFYFEKLAIDTFRLENLRKIKDKKILVSDYVKNDNDVPDAKERNRKEGFIPFVRSESNYHYHRIPDRIIDKNDDAVTDISQVKNYLYLINPEAFDSKQEYVDAIANTDFDLVTVDLFFDKYNPMTPEDIQRLKVKKSSGAKRLVICYINIGAAENWRYYWRPDWKMGSPAYLKKAYEGYENEVYVEYWNPSWQKIIFGNDDSYLKKIIDAGFDGAYLDNTEAYYELYRKD